MRKFVLFRSIPFQYVCSFCFGFSHKPKSKRPDGRPLSFFSRPRPNVSRLRRPGAARAQPCICIERRLILFKKILDGRAPNYSTAQN